MAKAKALADLGDTDLLEQLADRKEELFNLRFQFATGQLDNSAAIKATKKEIARVLTELRAREIADAEAIATDTADAATSAADATENEEDADG
jgi:large subunit ribosomal protein L29